MADEVEYTALSLDGGKIEGAIRSFPGNGNSDPAVEGKGFKTYTIELADHPPGLLQVFERGDGTHTLNFKLGKNRQLSSQVAQHVAEACKKSREITKPLSLKFISEDDWKFLQECLTEDGFKVEAEPLAHGERFKVSGSGKDQVLIHRFNTGRFLLQGKTRSAYSAVVNCLSYTKTEQKELIESQLATVPVTVADCGKLLSELEQRVPNAYAKLGDTLKTILAPALLVHKLSADLPDYTLMVFPALRGMEGCIKELFARRGQPLGTTLNVGNQFDPATRVLTPNARAKLNCAATCEAIDLIYGEFGKHRNGLLHVDATVETTRIIEKQAEAAEIVDAGFHIIDKAYVNVP